MPQDFTHKVYNTAGDAAAPYLALRSSHTSTATKIAEMPDDTGLKVISKGHGYKDRWWEVEIATGENAGTKGYAAKRFITTVAAQEAAAPPSPVPSSVENWYDHSQPYVSGDKYVVVLSYNVNPPDSIISPFIGAEGNSIGKLEVQTGLLQSGEFKESIKKQALEALTSHLAKQMPHIAPNMTMAPWSARGTIPEGADAYYVEPRPNKKIYLRVNFERSWADALPNKRDIEAPPPSGATHKIANTSVDTAAPYLALRSSPSSTFAKIAEMPDGTELKVLSKEHGNNKNWWQVEIVSGQNAGTKGYAISGTSSKTWIVEIPPTDSAAAAVQNSVRTLSISNLEDLGFFITHILTPLLDTVKRDVNSSTFKIENLNLDEEKNKLNMVVPKLTDFLSLNEVSTTAPSTTQTTTTAATGPPPPSTTGGTVTEAAATAATGPAASVAAPTKLLQFGFSDQCELLYIAHSSESSTTATHANALEKGFETLKSEPPFDSPRTNAFLYYAPAISDIYLKSAGNMNFEADNSSWQEFVQIFIFPEAKVVNDESRSEEQRLAQGVVNGDLQPGASSLLTVGRQDISEALKEEIYSHVQNEVEFIGDLNLQNVLNKIDELRTVDDLFDHVLNNTSLTQLISVAIGVVQSAASIAGINSSLCTEAFSQLSEEDIDNIVRPCLESTNPALWEKISNIKRDTFDSINATVQALGIDSLEKQDWKELDDMYCQHPGLKEALNDKSPWDMVQGALTDFIDLIATAEEEAQLCECMADNFLSSIEEASTQELLEMAVRNGPIGVAAAAGAGLILVGTGAVETPSMDEILEAGSTSIKLISQERIDIDLDQFALPTTDFIGDLPANFENQLKQAITDVLIGLVGMVLNLVKKRIMGDLTTDLENAIGDSLDPFGFSNISDLVMQSPINDATDRWGTSHKLAQVSKNSGVNFNSDDEANNFFNEISVSFSPSELSRMFKGLSIDAINNRNYKRVLAIIQANYANSIGSAVKTISQVRELFANVGGLIDNNTFNSELERFNGLKRSVADICEEEEASLADQLSDMLSNKDIIDQLKKERENNLEKGKQLLDLLNGGYNDSIPPLFCDPCDPSKKPIMNSQLHPSQQHLNDSVNLELYKGILSIFHSEIDNYKPVILEVEGLANKLFLGKADGDDDKTSNLNKLAALGNEPDGAGNASMIALLKGFGFSFDGSGTKASPFVASKLRENLKQSFDNINSSSPTPYIKLLSYSVQNYRLDLAFNFTDVEREYFVSSSLRVGIAPQSYKITVIDISNIDQGHTHIVTEQQAGFTEESVASKLSETLTKSLQPYGNTVFPLSQLLQQEFDKLLLPTLEILLESSLVKTAETNLFERTKFNSLQLKSSPINCGPPEEGTSLLNIQDLRDEVSKYTNQLQCHIPYDVPPGTPSVVEMSNLIGIIKLTLRVFVIEEYLKNIFVFSLYKMTDIIKNDVYMNFVIEKVYASLGSSDVYTNLQNYSLEAVNLLRKMGEDIPQEIATPQDAIRYLVRMTAEEVSNTLDTRIQEQIYSQEEKSEFFAFEGVSTEDALEKDYIGRFLKHMSFVNSIQSIRDLKPRVDTKSAPGSLIFEDTDPLDKNFNGGFIFQEYVQITSRFASSDGRLKFNQKIAALEVYDIDKTILDEVIHRLKTDKHYRFLVRPGTTESYYSTNQHVWSNPLEAFLGTHVSNEKKDQFLYRGKCDIGKGLTYYESEIKKALEYTNENIDYYTNVDQESLEIYQTIRWILSDMAYTDWFEPLKYGMRLMLMIPVLEDFDTSLILPTDTIDDEQDPNYIKFLEDKIFSYSNYLTDQKMLAFPIGNSGEIPLTQGENESAPLTSAFSAAMNFAGGWDGAVVGEMRSAVKLQIYEQFKTNDDIKQLFEHILPIKGMVLMTALYHRAEMEALYPELATLFNGTKKSVADLFTMQLAAINRDYGFETDLLSSTDPSDQLAGMGIDYGKIVFNFLQLTSAAIANFADPTWETPWFFPGPLNPYGYTAKILNMIDIDFGGQGGGGDPAMLGGGKLYDPTASKCKEQDIKETLVMIEEEEEAASGTPPPDPPPEPADPVIAPEKPEELTAAHSDISWSYTVSQWLKKSDDHRRTSWNLWVDSDGGLGANINSNDMYINWPGSAADWKNNTGMWKAMSYGEIVMKWAEMYHDAPPPPGWKPHGLWVPAAKDSLKYTYAP